MRLLTTFEKLEGCGPSQPSFKASEAPQPSRPLLTNVGADAQSAQGVTL